MNAAGWTISIIAILTALGVAIRVELAGRRERSLHETRGELTVKAHGREQHEFMSSAWIVMARREITRTLAGRNLGPEAFTLSEEFTDAPMHLRGGDDSIGFSVRISNGTISVDGRPDPRADLRVISNYADAVAAAHDEGGASNDPVEAARRVADGRLRIEGDPSRLPPVLQELDIHALLARHTL